MLQLEHVCKSYTTNSFTQVALDDVSLAFRDNEFVSILGPSGSGKTTMLNVIGGLDHFDSGDLVIDGVSTREYRDRDWDAYRNNRIGFVFQSYNLIPHQTILANVELALTLSGVSASERRERARQALAEVGLGDHVDKRPSQLSGGQMQRVAIARALINDPEILLADEPTGALDSKTSVQVMDLLREVADDRLVIMVTHNPELARQYSTRIVELADGRIRDDSDPFLPNLDDMRDAKPPKRTSMSFLTALALSFNNLMTKKGRTLMTAFAGSIGIIGIAAILSLANGVNAYIKEVEEETLSVYPLQIMKSGFDMTSMIMDVQGQQEELESEEAADKNKVIESRMVGTMFGSVGNNDLGALKSFIEKDGGGINQYVQDIEYSYDITPQVFLDDVKKEAVQVNPDTTFQSLGFGGSSAFSSSFSTNVFEQMPDDLSLVENQFDIRAGRWPKEKDELLVVLSPRGTMSDFMSYAMGLRDRKELKEMVDSFSKGEEVEVPEDELTFTLDQIMTRKFRVVPATKLYVRDDEHDVWTKKTDDKKYMKSLVKDAQQLKVVGIVQRKEDVDASTMSMGIYYTPQLTNWLMEQAAESKIVKDQLAHKDVNVFSGKSFDDEAEERSDKLDMSSLFKIDEDKMAEAFTVDTDSLDLSALDFSGLESALDMSDLASSFDPSAFSMPEIDPSVMATSMEGLSNLQIDLSNVDFSQIDMSKVDLSGVDTSTLFSPEVMAALAPDLTSIDTRELFAGVTPRVDSAALANTVTALQAGLARYLAAHPVDPSNREAMDQAVSEYLATDDAQTILAGLNGAVSFSEADQQLIASRLQEQVRARSGEEVWNSLDEETREKLGNDAQRAVGTLAVQVAEQVGEQVGNEVAKQITAQLGDVLSSVTSGVLGSYFEQVMGSYFTAIGTAIGDRLSSSLQSALADSMTSFMEDMMGSMRVDEEKFAEAFESNMGEKELAELMQALMGTERMTYSSNLTKLGYAKKEVPSEIDIYPIDFESKSSVIQILDNYNDEMNAKGEEDKAITYTDLVGALMTSVTEIVNMISYVLIAFVAISLVVSSIMIGVITYISVLERRKEIGILRSIGASKGDVSRVFNAETVIEGFVSGIMGVTLTALGCIPANIIVEANFDVERVARLPVEAAFILVGVSVFLSFIAGLLPARKAAKADPVEALRSE